MKAKKLLLISLLIYIGICIISCSGSCGPISRLEELTKELEENSSYYSAEDWLYVFEEYDEIENELLEYSYSDEKLKEIAFLQGKCYAYLMIGAEAVAGDELDRRIDCFESAAAGFFDVYNDW